MKMNSILPNMYQKLTLKILAVFFGIALFSNNTMATNYQVTNTNSSGYGSFPWALEQANYNEDLDIISFNISGSGTVLINLDGTDGSGMDVGNPVLIDGTTLPGYNPGTRHIIIKDEWGMSILSTDVTLKGIELQHRKGSAIYIGLDNDGNQHANINLQNNAFVFLGSAPSIDGGIEISTGYEVSILNNFIGCGFDGMPKGNTYSKAIYFTDFPTPVGGGNNYPTDNIIAGNHICNAVNGILLNPNDPLPHINNVKISQNTMTGITGNPLTIGSGHNLTGSGGRINPSITSATTSTVTGTTNNNDVVELFLTDNTGKNITEYLGNGTANASGNYSINGFSIASGSYVMVLSYDANGNTSSFSSFIAAEGEDALVVTKTTDDGSPGTLRWAIIASNFNSGPDKIHFNIPQPAIPQIVLTGELPSINGSLIIDGTTQPGYNPGYTHVEITNGFGYDYTIPFFKVYGSNTTIKGLSFYFERTGIYVKDGSLQNIVIEENSFRGHASSAGFFTGVELHSSFNLIVRNNFFGTTFLKQENNHPLNYGIWFKDHSGEIINAKALIYQNYFGNCKTGIALEALPIAQTITNCKFFQNIFKNTITKPITIFSPHNNFGPGMRVVPTITAAVSEHITGTANANDWVEIYRAAKSGKNEDVWDPVQYVGRIQANASGNWTMNGMNNPFGAAYIAKSYNEDVNGDGNSTEFGNHAVNSDPNSDMCVVTNTSDYHDTFEDPIEGSLRWAINKANTDPSCNVITFDIPGEGIAEITLKIKTLPTITRSVTIDGTSLLGFDTKNKRYVRVIGGGTNSPLIRIEASNVTIKGLELVTGNIGISIGQGFENLTIENNAIRKKSGLSGQQAGINLSSAKNALVVNNIIGADFGQTIIEKPYNSGVYLGWQNLGTSSVLANAKIENNTLINCGEGITLAGDFSGEEILKNCFFTRNIFLDLGSVSYYSGKPIAIKSPSNNFLNPRTAPIVNNVGEDFVSGTANANDVVEIYKCEPSKFSKHDKKIWDVVEYLGNATANGSGNWTFAYTTQSGDAFIAKSYDAVNKNSTEFGTPFNNCFLADFSFETCVGNVVPFNAFVTGNAPSDLTYAWTFGHDYNIVFEKDPVHTFPTDLNKSYLVTLTVTGGGCEVIKEKYVTVREALLPNFELPSSPCIGTELTFVNTTPSTGLIGSWKWAYGDGSDNTYEKDGNHTYKKGGSYDVSLTVFPFSDPDSLIKLCENKTVVKRLTLNTGAAAGIDGPDKVCKDVPITYRNEFYKPGVTYTWKVNGTVVAGDPAALVYTFPAIGNYEVELIANDGCTGSDKLDVLVDFGPDFGPPSITKASCTNAADGSLLVQVTGFAGEKIKVELIKDGIAVRAQVVTSGTNVNMVGLLPGTYTLRASNELGCSKEITIEIKSLAPEFTNACAGRSACGGAASTVYFSFTADRTPGGNFKYKILRATDDAEMENSSGQSEFSGTFSSIQNVELVNILPGNYRIVILNDPATDNLCEVEKTVNVKAFELSSGIVLDNNNPVCKPQTDTRTATITVNNNNNGCTGLNISSIHYKLYHKGIAPGSDYEFLTEKTSAIIPQEFEGLYAGGYRVEISFSGSLGSQPLNCEHIAYFTIKAQSRFYLDTLRLIHPNCEGEDGSAEAIVKGDPVGIKYLWFREGETDPINKDPNLYKIENLAPGNYRLEIEDANGCSSILPVTFTINPANTLEIPDVDANNCEATATTSGGTPPYEFEWFKKLEGKNPISGENYPPNTWKSVFTEGTGTGVYASSYSGEQGTFKVVATDQKGCKSTSEEFVLKTDVPQIVDLCFNWRLGKPEGELPPAKDPDNPTKDKSDDIIVQIQEEQDKCINKSAKAMMDAVDQFCLNADILEDELSIQYDVKHHHYTLFYYDRPGNLVKTIPPAGVDLVNQNHTYPSAYEYNSLAQNTNKETVDGGEMVFRYDALGRIRYSQDAKQATEDPVQFSYLNYDELGRLIESGLAEGNFNGADTELPLKSSDYNILERSVTTYTQASDRANYLGKKQRFLTNRISSVYYKNQNGDESTIYYSYDPHGNAEWALSQIPGLGKKTIEYQYDIVSGNVNQVILNKGAEDQFYHRLEYDEDNRITNVLTSHDGFLWENDASYTYSKHGTRDRMTLGEDLIQGLDYVYTIQGRLKGINTPNLDKTKDFGRDGNTYASLSNNYAPDVFGMALQYYNGDFERSGEHPFNSNNTNPFHVTNNKELFNGNIASWTSKIDVPVAAENYAYAGQATAQNFTYDKLNRLKESEFLASNGTSWTSEGNKYKTGYNYDANGNLTGLERYTKDGGRFDNFTYHYYNNVEGKPTNQLKNIDDDGTPILMDGKPTDITDQAENNYGYDAIGNIIEDQQEQIKLKWNNLKLIEEVIPMQGSDKPHIKFSYNGLGQRVKKWVNNSPEFDAITGELIDKIYPDQFNITFYQRNASGATVAVYKEEVTRYDDFFEVNLFLKEVVLNGAERLGSIDYNTDEMVPLAKGYFKQEDNFQSMDLQQILENINMFTPKQTEWFIADKNKEINLNGSNIVIPSISIAAADLKDNLASTLAEFQGNNSKFLATGINKNGQTDFVATAAGFWGETNTLLILNQYGELIKGSENIEADVFSKPVVVKDYAASGNYFLFTRSVNGNLQIHKINVNLVGFGNGENPKGEAEMLQSLAIPGAKFGRELTVVDDAKNKKTWVYTTLFNQDTKVTSLVRLMVNEDGFSPDLEPLVTFTNTDENGTGAIRFSNDGKGLYVYHKTKNLGFYNHHLAKISRFELDESLKPLEHQNSDGLKVELKRGNLGKTNYLLSPDSRYLYYNADPITASVTTNKGVFQQDLWLPSAASQVVVANETGDMTYTTDGIYFFPESKTEPKWWNHGALEVKTLNLGSSYKFNGGIAGTSYKLEDLSFFTQDARRVGLKQYELKDHLSNVRAVVTDRKMIDESGNLTAEVVNASNYLPFGMAMPGRNYSAESYRYGFNGMEKDDEVKGNGNSYDFGARIYDPRVGRWLGLDPMADKFPDWSGYNYALNNSILFIDPNGKWPEMPSWDDVGDALETAGDVVVDVSKGAADAAMGAVAATVDNVVGSNIRDKVRDYALNEDKAAFDAGATTADVAELAIGAYAAGKGTTVAAGALTVTVVAVAAEGPTLGTSTVVVITGGATAAAAGAVAVGGGWMAANAGKNLAIARQKHHGNSLQSRKKQHGYQITDKTTGEVQEYGISGQKLNQNGTSPRVNQKLRTKYNNDPNMQGEVIEPNLGSSRKSATKWEKDKVREFKDNNGHAPPGQIRPKVD